MTATLFPAGLNDLSFEIYKRANQIYVLNDGKTIAYEDFPKKLLELIDAIIELRPKAKRALLLLGITGKDEQRIQFINCNLSNFDFSADASACLTKITTEYVECSLRGVCPHEGKLCSPVAVENGTLSMRELRIMGLIRHGLFDKEIAEALFISPETVKTTKRNIQRKLRVERKAMIASVATIMQIN